jgi:hypothetical protein
LIATCKEEIALLKPRIAKGAHQKLGKRSRAPKEFRLAFFASQNKQVQKKHRNSEEPPFAIRGAGDTLADVEKRILWRSRVVWMATTPVSAFVFFEVSRVAWLRFWQWPGAVSLPPKRKIMEN